MTWLRPAKIEDIPAMGELWKGLVLEENPKACPNVKFWNDIQTNLFKMKNYYVYVVEQDGKIVGFNNGLLLTDIETGETYIDGGNFFVLPKYRKGLAGLKLHRNTFDTAKRLGAKFLRRKVSANNDRMMDRLTKHLGKTHRIKEYIVDEFIGGKL